MKIAMIAAVIGNINTKINLLIVEELNKHGISGLVPTHGGILHYLSNNGKVTMKELSVAIKRDKSTVTALVKKLLAYGYVKKEQCGHDHRTIYVSLTEKGVGLEPMVADISEVMLNRVWLGISDKEQEDVIKILKKIEANF
jgi:DNA-binding MarR family transcriptional regulator